LSVINSAVLACRLLFSALRFAKEHQSHLLHIIPWGSDAMARLNSFNSIFFGLLIVAAAMLIPGFGPSSFVGADGAAYAQTRMQRALAQRQIQVIPNLEVQKL
jgi:uncharacterized membrane protein